MRLQIALYCSCLVSLPAASVGIAQSILSFDDLSSATPENGWAVIQNDYGDLQWGGFGVLNGSTRPLTEGYRTGVISPDNIAFNMYGDPAFISSGSPFDLSSCYMTAPLHRKC